MGNLDPIDIRLRNAASAVINRSKITARFCLFLHEQFKGQYPSPELFAELVVGLLDVLANGIICEDLEYNYQDLGIKKNDTRLNLIQKNRQVYVNILTHFREVSHVLFDPEQHMTFLARLKEKAHNYEPPSWTTFSS